MTDDISKTITDAHAEKTQKSKETFEVKGIVSAFVAALKNYALYPESHNIRQKSTVFAKACLENYLMSHETLRLTVEKSKLLFQGEAVYLEKPDEKVLTYPLFRDGIHWFELQNGMTIEELQTLLNLLTKHRTAREEAEDDLATEMWEVDFPHLRYKVDEGVWVGEPVIEFSSLRANPISIEQTEARAAQPLDVASKANPLAGQADFMKLSFIEENQIKALIDEEEARNSTQDCLDVLVVVLQEQNSQADYDTIIQFLTGEIQYALSQCEFSYILSFLDAVETLSQKPVSGHEWLAGLSADFRKRIAGPEALAALAQAWPQVNTMTDEQMADLRRLLLRLPSDVIYTLLPMLSRIRYSRIEEMLMGVIAMHAGNSPVDIAALVDELKERMVRRFITLLGEVGTDASNKLLFDLTRHSSDKVREYAIHALLDRDMQNMRVLFSRMKDEQPDIQRLMCKHLGKQRSSLAEELLLNYLETNRLKTGNREHILDCYRALGRCAGPGAIPYLEKKLLKQDWKALLGMTNDLHRQGAAMALWLMPKQWHADDILDKAARSFFRGIRQACREGEKEAPGTVRRK